MNGHPSETMFSRENMGLAGQWLVDEAAVDGMAAEAIVFAAARGGASRPANRSPGSGRRLVESR
jgi:hypothetical protein